MVKATDARMGLLFFYFFSKKITA